MTGPHILILKYRNDDQIRHFALMKNKVYYIKQNILILINIEIMIKSDTLSWLKKKFILYSKILN